MTYYYIDGVRGTFDSINSARFYLLREALSLRIWSERRIFHLERGHVFTFLTPLVQHRAYGEDLHSVV